jgi:adhesin transport system outer membrane protein
VQNYDELWQKNSQNESRIGLDLRFNLYNGNRDQLNVRRSLDEVNVAKDLRDKVCVDIRQTLQISFNDVNKIRDQLPVLNQHRPSSDKLRVAYKNQFDIGQRSLLDVLDAENEHFQAARAYAIANFDLSQAVTRTLTGMGQLLNAIEVSRSALPTLSDLGTEPLEASPEEICGLTEIDSQVTSLRGDDDGDGVPNYRDLCPDTPKGDRVDSNGCSIFEATEISIGLKVFFPHDSDLIDQSYMDDIAALAEYLKRFPNTKVEIQGHTSAVGADWYNQLLSERRAKAVANILSQRYGINGKRVTSVGFASSRPLVQGFSEQAHSQNRRIEAVITPL